MVKKKLREEKKLPENNSTKSRGWIALAGAGTQMGLTIYLATYLGKYLDQKYPADKNWWTIGLTLLGVGVALYTLIKQVNNINSK